MAVEGGAQQQPSWRVASELGPPIPPSHHPKDGRHGLVGKSRNLLSDRGMQAR